MAPLHPEGLRDQEMAQSQVPGLILYPSLGPSGSVNSPAHILVGQQLHVVEMLLLG